MKKPLLERFQKLAGIKPLYEIEDASPGASGPGLSPPGDVEKSMKIVGQFVNNRIEYEALLIAILQFDVPGKKAAITKALKDHPTLRSALLGQDEFSDEENNLQTYKFKTDNEYTIDGEEPTDGEDANPEDLSPEEIDDISKQSAMGDISDEDLAKFNAAQNL